MEKPKIHSKIESVAETGKVPDNFYAFYHFYNDKLMFCELKDIDKTIFLAYNSIFLKVRGDKVVLMSFFSQDREVEHGHISLETHKRLISLIKESTDLENARKKIEDVLKKYFSNIKNQK